MLLFTQELLKLSDGIIGILITGLGCAFIWIGLSYINKAFPLIE